MDVPFCVCLLSEREGGDPLRMIRGEEKKKRWGI